MVLLELEVRYPRAVEWRRGWFTVAAAPAPLIQSDEPARPIQR